MRLAERANSQMTTGNDTKLLVHDMKFLFASLISEGS